MSDLDRAFMMQHELQVTSYGKDPVGLEGEDRVEFIRWNVLALTDELHEALAETGWKPWASSKHVNEEAFKSELVDAFHFFMNLCLVADMGPAELMTRYEGKRLKNALRQANGYDGLNKCPRCMRAYDDDHVKCHPAVAPDDEGKGTDAWCEVYG